jgi:putative heme degradation protein
LENTMLNLSGLPLAPAVVPHLTRWEDPDDESPSGSRVWPLRPAWAVIVQAALALGPVTVRAGDGLCRVEHRAHLRWLERMGRDSMTLPGAGMSIDTTGWALGVATQARLNDGRVRRGFAFFDDRGHAVLELDLASGASPDRFHAIVRTFALGTEAGAERAGLASVHAPALQSRPRTVESVHRRLAWPSAEGVLEDLADEDLAQPLAGDALLEVLRQTRQSRLPMSAQFGYRGLQLIWTGVLHHLDGRAGVALVSGFGIELQWSETLPGPQAWLIREPTSSGLRQSLALLAPDGDLRLLLAPQHAPARPQPCAWRLAINAACGGHCGSAC